MFLYKTKGRLACSHCTRPMRVFCKVIGVFGRTVGQRVRIFALREKTSLLLSLPTSAETTVVGRRAETETAIAKEGGTQLAAACDRCSS